MSQVSRKVKTKYFVDVGLLLSFLACLITGILKLPGFIQFYHKASISLPLSQITLIHDRSGILLGIFALLHLSLNWKWMVSVTRKLLGR
jgi:hypothetical protein